MNETIKSYFKTNFQKKKVITKVIILAIAFVVVLIPSISFYFWLVNKQVDVPIGKNKFWYIQVQWNPGIAFSGLSNKPGAIYAIQSIVFIVLVALFWLLVKDRITSSFLACAIFGGLFNLIQRACAPAEHAHMVLDYFKFGFWDSFAVFNWPDMFVVCGVFGFIISYITHLIIDATKESRKTKEKINSVDQPAQAK